MTPRGPTLLLLLAAGVALLTGCPADDNFAPPKTTLPDTVEVGSRTVKVELSLDTPSRRDGLMHRTELADDRGMLFIFPVVEPRTFWMRNTLIPLDLIFADARGVVERVHSNAVPLDETSIPGGDAIQFVLEINGGLAEVFGIAPGTEMRHPAIPDAVWTCD